MTELVHGKVMHLINEDDYQLLKRLKQDHQEENVTSENIESDEVRVKKYDFNIDRQSMNRTKEKL